MFVCLERNILRSEEALSFISALPGVGIASGAAKMGIGSIQLISGVAFGVFFGLPFTFSGSKDLLEHSWTHIKNGAGNIVAGFFEGIPIVGSFIYFFRREAKLNIPGNIYQSIVGKCDDLEEATRGPKGKDEQEMKLIYATPESLYKHRIMTGQEGKLRWFRYPQVEEEDWKLAHLEFPDAERVNQMLDDARTNGGKKFVRDMYHVIRDLEAENNGILDNDAISAFHVKMAPLYSAEIKNTFSSEEVKKNQ